MADTPRYLPHAHDCDPEDRQSPPNPSESNETPETSASDADDDKVSGKSAKKKK